MFINFDVGKMKIQMLDCANYTVVAIKFLEKSLFWVINELNENALICN